MEKAPLAITLGITPEVKEFLRQVLAATHRQKVVTSHVIDGIRHFYAPDEQWIGQMDELAFRKAINSHATSKE